MDGIQHQVERQRFVIEVEGHEALLEYRMVSPSVIDFIHTYTPHALRGRGIAARLVDAGLAHAEAQRLQVIGSCSYVAKVLRERGLG